MRSFNSSTVQTFNVTSERTVPDVPVVPVVSVVPDEPLIKLKRFKSLRDIGTVRECVNRQRPFGRKD
jgi:hypothetical protein